jgi:membrane AbrB-like protein
VPAPGLRDWIRREPSLQWGVLAAVSVALALALGWANFPAAFLLGPMIAAIACGLGEFTVRVPRLGFTLAQGVLGCMIARALKPAVVSTIAQDWPSMVLTVLVTVAAAMAVAWTLLRTGSLPGTTAAWGTMPGAATGMIAMAEDFGADPRVVAFMQYMRVTCVVVVTALVTRFWFGLGAGTGPSELSGLLTFDPPGIIGAAEALALAAAFGMLGVRLGIPAGGLILPMLAAALLQGVGLYTIVLPPWLLAAVYAVVGWYVGLRFTRRLVGDVVSAIPQMLAGALGLIGLCLGSAWVLTRLVHTDALTAFLATMPGGIDSIAIISAGSRADLGFVFALQALRMFVVIMSGPVLARLVIRLLPAPERQGR